MSASRPRMAVSSQSIASGGSLQCDYCHKSGHSKDDCWKAKGLCLLCGGADHRAAQCPNLRKTGSAQMSQA